MTETGDFNLQLSNLTFYTNELTRYKLNESNLLLNHLEIRFKNITSKKFTLQMR